MVSKIKFDAIIFDFDGVLVESVDVKTRAFASLYESYGSEIVRDVVAYHLQHGGMSRFEKFRYFHQNLLGKELTNDAEFELCSKFSTLVEYAVVQAPFVIGAIEFLQKFHDKLKLFVASGTPDDELKRIATKRDISKYFVSLHGSPATKVSIIYEILQTHDLEQSKVLMVGDAMTDYDAALMTHVNFVWRISQAEIKVPEGVKTIADLTELDRLIINSACEPLCN